MCLAVLTHQDILAYIVKEFREERRLFDDSILQLRIGTFEELGGRVVSVTPDVPLLEVLELMSDHEISCVPVIEPQTRRVLDLYSRSYVTYLARMNDIAQYVQMRVLDVLEQQRAEVGLMQPCHTCRAGDSLHSYSASLRGTVCTA